MMIAKRTPRFFCYFFATLLVLTFSSATNAQPSNWSAVLPAHFPVNTSGQINGISRVSQMKFHPTDSNKIYAISARGGLFISSDAGNSWKVTPGTDFMPTNRLASVCVDYHSDSVIYLGTGDHDYYYNGTGVWKSINGGQSFTQTTLTNVMVVELLMDPVNDSTLVACTNKGIYKTYNAGLTWTAKTATTIQFDDMKRVASPLSRTLFAASNDSALYRSTDFGETWIQLSNGIHVPSGFSSGDGCRIALSAADTSLVYFAMVVNGGTVFRSLDLGNSFTAVKITASPYLTYYDDTITSSTQGDYNFGIGADNRNPNILYLVAHNVWRSLNGGVSWTELTHWYAKVHTDMHQVTVNPYNPSQLWDMNDGGVWLSLDSGNTWTPKSDGIFGYEIYHGNCSPTRADMISIGTQDNGELYADTSGWFTNRGGDWSPECAFDYRPASSMVYYYNSNERRLVGGGSHTYGLQVSELQDIAFNRNNTGLAFAADTAIYRTFNLLADTPVWTQIDNPGKVVMSMRSSLADINKLFLITNDAHIYVSNNALAASPALTLHVLPSNTNNAASVTTIKNKPGVVYVTCNTKVYRSADTGVTWTNITYNLPSVNQVRIISDEYYPDSEMVFVASNNAVYYKTLSQTSWTLFDAHLPSRPSITDMSVYNDSTANTMLRVAVYGRGMWQTPISALRPLNAIMTSSIHSGCAGVPVYFSDVSTGAVVSRVWSFPGGSPVSSTVQNPLVTYANYGTYPVTLKVYNLTDSSVVTNVSYITVTPGANLNVVEGFEDTIFPPSGCSLSDPGSDGFAWQRFTGAGAYGTSSACMYFDNFNEDAGGRVNDVITQRYDLTGYTSVKMSFDRAYKVYTDPSEIDSFAILISTDCGNSFSQIYRKGGTQLATVTGTGSYTFPQSGDWRSDTVDLSPYIGQSAILAFRNLGYYGNDLFIDNINIHATLTANAGADVAYCAGDSAGIGSAPVSALTYMWTPAVGLSSASASNPVANPTSTTTYILTATQPYSHINAHDTVTVTVNHLNVSESISSSICYGTNQGNLVASASSGSGHYTYLWSNGNSTAIADSLTSGVYTVTVHDNTTGCSVTGTDTILQRPRIFVQTLGDTIPCASTGGIADVSATGGTGYLHYKWNNGDTATSLSNLNTGNYVVTVTDSTGCTTVGYTSVQQAGSPPQLSVEAPDSLTCKVHRVILVASSPNNHVAYFWNDSVKTPSDTVSTPGYFSVTAIDTSTGCRSYDTIMVTQTIVMGHATITTDKSVLCPGDSAHICGPSGYLRYLWNNGDTSICVLSSQTGLFYLRLTDSTGCVDTSNRVSVQLAASPSVVIHERSDTLFAPSLLVSYQWELNGHEVSGATGENYVPVSGGTYSVIATDTNGCSAVSNQVVITGLGQIARDNIEIYPNPLKDGAWTLAVGDSWIGSTFEITDGAGRVIARERILFNRTSILPDVSAGIYFLRFPSQANYWVKKLIKLKP